MQIIQVGNKEIKLNFNEMNELDLEDVLTIDYSNIKDEVSVFPFIVNQLGFLLSESQNILRKEELQLELLEAKIEEYKSQVFLTIKSNLISNGEKSPTLSLIESQIKIQEQYRNLQKSYFCQKQKIIEAQKNKDHLNTLYWSAQSKQQTLVSLSKSINLDNL